MSANEKYATMEDVARLSGVSKGTVDRVLHDISRIFSLRFCR